LIVSATEKRNNRHTWIIMEVIGRHN
jgi:hypothetical protein